jgi:hypothetical protein
MKDVVAVLGGRISSSPVFVELVAYGIPHAGVKKTTSLGLKAIAKALSNCPALSANCEGPVSVGAGGDGESLTLSVRIESVTVTVVIRANPELIGDSANVEINEHLD